ncbi:MAG: HAD-superfamily hydrolase, subfamily variant 3 [Candidatus Saccharibacteria bacterium]|nr:HAD-superfamily hydrolase, subfamily variant 3 [Candidatus Saccharibacteria bacterium]
MIKAVIFDCFGVLVTEGWEPFLHKYLHGQTQKLNQAHKLGEQLNLGQITYNQFIDQTADLAGVTSEVARSFIDKNLANTPLFDHAFQELKGTYKIGMLSNAGDNWLEMMFTPQQLQLFDDIVLSYKVGIIKPNPEIYQLSAKRLGVEVGECVLVDDSARHVAGALATGMQAILYKDFDQMRRELEALLTSVA